MFDALRRAEAERRRRVEADEPRMDRLPGESVAQERATEAVVVPPLAPPGAAPGPSRNGSDPFGGDMLRELGILRNAIESRLEEKEKRAIMFTSALHGEGVTTLATSYARLLALHGGERVLLMELNGRTPALARRLGVTSAGGITHLFGQEHALASMTHAVANAGFDVVHVGEANPTKIQVSLERALPRLIHEALATHDTVIIDAPPVVLSPESPPIARHVDGVVVVVQSGRTKREVVQRSVRLVEQFEGRVLGIVINRKRYYIPDFIYRRL